MWVVLWKGGGDLAQKEFGANEAQKEGKFGANKAHGEGGWALTRRAPRLICALCNQALFLSETHDL